MINKIIIKGAREHNLKNIDLELPRDKFIVFTGISGSGKSTLAFDTIFAESQRRYLESLSAYARQFLGQMEKPDVDYIEGLSPAISIDQKSAPRNPRSTVGTVTEIHDYLRLLYAKIGIPYCPNCGTAITKMSIEEMAERVLDLGDNARVQILSPVVRGRKGEYTSLLKNIYNQGFSKARVNGEMVELEDADKIKLAKYQKHNIDVLVDEFELNLEGKERVEGEEGEEGREGMNDRDILSRIFEGLETAVNLSKGIAIVLKKTRKQKNNKTKGKKLEIRNLKLEEHDQSQAGSKAADLVPQAADNEAAESNNELYFNQNLSCAKCGYSFPEIEPRLFSFNSPYGACPECNGLGVKREISAKAVMPDESKTIAQGGILPWSYAQNNYWGALLKAVADEFRIDLHTPIKNLKGYEKDLLLYGLPPLDSSLTREETEGAGQVIRVKYYSKSSPNIFFIKFNGIINHLQERYFKTDSDAVRREIEKYMEMKSCPVCGGSRYKQEALLVKVSGKNIAEVSRMNVSRALNFFHYLCGDENRSIENNMKSDKQKEIEKLEIKKLREPVLTRKEHLIADKILKEIINRLKFLKNVGLDYLTLDRTANTLAGGEAQRIRLASQLGSALVGVLYVLDEPSIGLHARDNKKLLDTLKYLKNLGNTLIVIEHDEETIREADYIVDIGPFAGEHGGKIVAQGNVGDIINAKDSLTGQYLSGKKKITVPKERRKLSNKKFLTVIGASENNLKNIKVEFPLKTFTCVTGVSGSGKSSLVNDILYKELARKYHRSLEKPGRHKEIKGAEYLDKVINIDQSPIGRTPRSNPATYVSFFTPIRELFAKTRLSRARGYGAGRFSFNITGGRCDNCQGDGFLKIEMQFMPDVYIPCDICEGKRYNKETLDVRYKGKNISEVLDMSVEEAMVFFADIPQIGDKLKTLYEVGLGYIRLGQAATTLSGGEAQRIKLATELSKRATGKTLYILDEPTTGLHFEDINKLLNVLQRLVDAGNSVIVIEHNMDVIKQADWIIDLGPEGGEEGGRVVACGTPEEVAQDEASYTGRFLREVLGI
ncbi:MAG: excinuclease ABC subunit UvrA [bacterium]